MRCLPAIMTPNTQTGKSRSWITPPGNSMTLTQGPWKFSALGWVEENLMKDWDVLLACKKEAHVYGPSLSKQDDWNARVGTVAGTAHTQEYLLLHIAMFPIGAHFWCRVLGMPSANQLQAQIISRAMKLLRFCPIIPAHRKPPWPGYTHGLRLFTKLLVAHPLVGVCLPPEIRPADSLRLTGYMIGAFQHPRAQRWLVCRNGMGNNPLRVPRC